VNDNNSPRTTGDIRARREAAGLTQRQLASAARCSLTFIANIEAGCGPRKSRVMPRIFDAIDVAETERELCGT
jgi:predicted transcriptional regulator